MTILERPGRGRSGFVAPDGRDAVALRDLRTAVALDATRRGTTVLLFTGTSSGEGVSTIASNHARLTTLAGQRTVLVDANLDRPVLHERLGRQRSPGLTDVLIGKTDLPSALATVSVGSTELSLLPAGTPTPGVAELLSRPLTAEVISALAEAYDAVIIDAGPVAETPDTVVLSAHPEVDTVLVVGHRQRRQRVDQTVQRLRRAGGHVLGVTVNTG